MDERTGKGPPAPEKFGPGHYREILKKSAATENPRLYLDSAGLQVVVVGYLRVGDIIQIKYGLKDVCKGVVMQWEETYPIVNEPEEQD